MKEYDRIIVGAGIYGLYSALYCAEKGEKILVLEKDNRAFSRATYVNQARVHMGYHYPRSISTALKSRKYFDRFIKDYGFCILKDFDQVYATSSEFSYTSGNQFKKFCDNANIFYQEIGTDAYFKEGMCDKAFFTKEYTYDAMILKDYFLDKIKNYSNVEIEYNTTINSILKNDEIFIIQTEDNSKYASSFVLNATYAGVNEVHKLLGFEAFKIKYELCEIILCDVNNKLKEVGLTVMDGPFFSIMPFGETGYHSLTSVTFTPHSTSYDVLPTFKCQKNNGGCTPYNLKNCNYCNDKPKSAWEYMSTLAKKYMRDDLDFKYVKSLYSMKPILKQSEIDDSRPTVIRVLSEKPKFVSILSGKINTIYDLEEILK